MAEIYHADDTLNLLLGDALEVLRTLQPGFVDCVVTSPPYYGLRDYCGNPQQIGLEQSPAEYVARLVAVFAEVRRVLAGDGTLWLNLGDRYAWTGGHSSPGSKPSPLLNPTGKRGEDQRAGRTRHWSGGQSVPAGFLNKSLMLLPWRLLLALSDDGWIVRNVGVWAKPNAMPESVTDRLRVAWEPLILLVKNERYWFDLDPIREPLAHPEALTQGIVFGGKNGGDGKVGSSGRRGGGHRSVYGGDVQPGQRRPKNGGPGPHHRDTNERGRNPGDVWTIPTRPLPEAHFAAFPVDLPRRCILAGCRPGGTVLDPFSGAGTTALAAQQVGRRAVGIDINAEYHDIALRRMSDAPLPFDADPEVVV